MYDGCHRSWAAATPVKHECDIKELTNVLRMVKNRENKGTEKMGSATQPWCRRENISVDTLGNDIKNNAWVTVNKKPRSQKPWHIQGSFCACTQPMRDGVTMQRLSHWLGAFTKWFLHIWLASIYLSDVIIRSKRLMKTTFGLIISLSLNHAFAVWSAMYTPLIRWRTLLI